MRSLDIGVLNWKTKFHNYVAKFLKLEAFVIEIIFIAIIWFGTHLKETWNVSIPMTLFYEISF